MSVRESAELALVRWKKLRVLQAHYPDFVPFLQDMMEELGFTTDEIQEDIAAFLEDGPMYLMIQAQRGQAKTTITAIFAVWCLIHDPGFRILIISAGDRQAGEISALIVRLILHVDILECLRPDRQAGDKTSAVHFDAHHSLKGINKSPSVQCMGINANLQGARADLLIADDVESGKNSRTAVQREQLLHITKDFTSINSTGRIVYLGTPQSLESIYNSLPDRGYVVRIWPGRYPTPAQIESYKGALAPMIAERVRLDPSIATGYGRDGQQGKATSPVIVNESLMLAKENDQGPAYFQLQHMLMTAMSDMLRYPLKVSNLVVMKLQGDHAPMSVVRAYGQKKDFTVNGTRYEVCPAIQQDNIVVTKMSATVLYVDPAGGGINGDETGWACLGHLNSNLFLRGIGGVPGGYDPLNLQAIADLVVRFRPTTVVIEKNLGFGAYTVIVTPIIRAACEEHGIPLPSVVEDYVSTQKEARIIETLEPVLGRGALVIDESVIEDDNASIQKYDLRIRGTYSFFHQLAKMTRERNALIHDDRVDALEGAVRFFSKVLAVDQQKAIAAAIQAEHEEWLKNPLGRQDYSLQPNKSINMLTKRIRRF